jgi:hypothetical protein
MAEWTRVVNTTIHKFLRQVEANVLRNRKLLALLQSKGRVTMGHSGDAIDWKVRYKRAPMTAYADMDTITFARQNRWLSALLDWRGYAMPDLVTKKEKLMNKGPEAIVKVFSEMASLLVEDLEDQFGDELYIDGNGAGNTKRLHGLESFLGDTGVEALGAPVYPPSDTYADLLTNLGNYGGAWSTDGTNVDWPSGKGDAHYDFWSPLIVKVTSTKWTETTKTWPFVCTEVLRYGIIKGRRNKSKKGMMDLILLDGEWFRLFEERIAQSERLVVTRNEPLGLWNLGFKDAISFEGCETTYEYGMPANTGYGIPTDQLELCSLQENLFVPGGPDYDPTNQGYRFWVDFFGNLKCASPRGFVKWKN